MSAQRSPEAAEAYRSSLGQSEAMEVWRHQRPRRAHLGAELSRETGADVPVTLSFTKS